MRNSRTCATFCNAGRRTRNEQVSGSSLLIGSSRSAYLSQIIGVKKSPRSALGLLVPLRNEALGAKLGLTYRCPPRRPSRSNGGMIAERIDLPVEHRGSGSVEEWVLFGGLVRGVSRPHEVPSILGLHYRTLQPLTPAGLWASLRGCPLREVACLGALSSLRLGSP